MAVQDSQAALAAKFPEVIWSRLRGVLHVVDEVFGSRVLPGGRGYLRPSITGDACFAA